MYSYFNFKKIDNEYLITNDFGKWMFIDKKNLQSLLSNGNIDDEINQRLIDNLFVYNDKYDFSERNKYILRDAKSFLFEPTSLHIFILTNNCNMNCIYCQAKDEMHINRQSMNIVTAERCVDFALSSPSNDLTFEFQGGEPLTNFETLKHVVLYSEANKSKKIIHYNLVSNLSLIDDKIIDFIKEYNINLSTSLDGNQITHDHNRKFQNGNGSFDVVKKEISRIRTKGIELNAIQTTTRFGMDYFKETVDAYIDLGFNTIFIRPLTRLGTADRMWNEIGYTAEEFISYYSKIIDYLIDLNKKNIQISEVHSAIFLTKILDGFSGNYMELRSPCGASIGQLAYFYDGSIFTCDEGRMIYEMGNESFKLGNVFKNTYDEIINSSVCKSTCVASLLESQLNCSDCVYQPYCGTCPVLNLAQDKDLIFKNRMSFRCKIYKGMLDTLFKHLKNKDTVTLFNKWV